MPVSYPLTLPFSPRNITVRPRSNVAVNVSPFTQQQEVYAWSGQWWELDMAFPKMNRAKAAALVAFLTALNGREGTFLAGNTANKTALGTATGTPLVNGASQTGYDLITDGWTHSITGILKAGDWIQLGSGSGAHLHQVVVDANSDGSGNATLTLWPKLRASPGDNDAIVVSSALGLFRLAETAEWSIDEAIIYGVNLKTVEAL